MRTAFQLDILDYFTFNQIYCNCSLPYRREFLLRSLMPFGDDRFLRHLEKLCNSGISLHGAQYLIGLNSQPVLARDMLLELQLEYIRFTYHKDIPSRITGLFAFCKYCHALKFKSDNGDSGKIYEVEASGLCHIADMNWLKFDHDPDIQKYNAQQYWAGKPFSTDKDYDPLWECVIELPVKIVRQVED